MRDNEGGLAATLASVVHPLEGSREDYTPLLERIGDARFVLLGEASHGTHEFYRARADITKRLIREKGFTAVVAEADWPDAYRVNRWVQGQGSDAEAEEALGSFRRRFPTWMWRNSVVLDFVGWLEAYNAQHDRRVGFYGLDVYSLHTSMEAVVDYLEGVDPALARRARERYGCFERFGTNAQAYGYRVGMGMAVPCDEEVEEQLGELLRPSEDLLREGVKLAGEEYFNAVQNARVVVGAERYYRSMFGPRQLGWNLRDTHMADTVDALDTHLTAREGEPARLVLWAHNSHLGDARATELGRAGQLNLGQLMRDRHGPECFLVGFSTHQGTVSAASEWDQPVERKRVRPSLAGSYESLFHRVGVPRFHLDLRDLGEASGALREERLQRAIGVVYLPQTERVSHYFHAELPAQFDAMLHFDETRALEPLERSPLWEAGELPDTYPYAL